MTSGLIIYNENRQLQITDTFRNLVLTQTGSVRIPARPYGNGTVWMGEYVGRVEVPTNASIIAIGLSTDPVAAEWNAYLGYLDFYVGAFNKSCEVPYYVFSPVTTLTGGRAGLQVLNSQGECMFDSNRKYMRVVGHLSGAQYGVFSDGRAFAEIALPKSWGERKAAAVVPKDWGYVECSELGDGAGWATSYRAGVYLKNGRVGVMPVQTSGPHMGSVEPPMYAPNYLLTVIDVTGF